MVLLPHLKYIESLVVSKLSVEQIKEKVQEIKFPVSDEVLAVIINTIRSKYPAVFYGTNPDAITAEWLRDSLDILEAFAYLNPEADFSDHKFNKLDKAFRILDDPLMYRIITSLAFANVEKEDIELITQAKFNLEYSAEDLQLFLKYFFNVRD